MLGCAQCLAPKKGSVNSREGEGREIQMGGDVCIPMADYFVALTRRTFVGSNVSPFQYAI